VLEAFDQYWRKTPHVKRLVLRVIPDHTTRVAALKRGEVDVVYLVSGELAEDLRRTPGLSLKTVFPSNHWLVFADQFGPKSPWHDQRVRLAANLALDRQSLNEAATLGFSKISGSIVPASLDFYWAPPLYPHDAARARKLLAEAGYPNGLDAGEFFCDLQVCPWGEAMLTNFKAVGAQLKLRPMERPAFFKGVTEKKYRNIVYLFAGNSGNGPPGSRPTRSRAGRTPTGATPTSMASSVSRPRSWTGPSARPSCTGYSSSSTSAPCSRPSGTSGSCTASARAWRSPGWGSSPATASPRRTRT
jgi:peptide/nickel transport system substrate-binding protein